MEENKTKVVIGEVRLSYVSVFEPKNNPDGTPGKYGLVALVPKDNTALVDEIKTAIRAAFEAAIPTKFGGTAPAKGKWKNPLRDGDEDYPEDENYAGCYYINCSSKIKPGVVKFNPTGNPKFIAITDPQEVYSGCYGHVAVNFYGYSASGNKGVSAGLNNVLKSKEGPHLSGHASAEADFGDIKPSSAPVPTEADDDIF